MSKEKVTREVVQAKIKEMEEQREDYIRQANIQVNAQVASFNQTIRVLREMIGENVREDVDYTTWRLPQLRKELKERGIDTRGNKTALIQRLQEDDATEYE